MNNVIHKIPHTCWIGEWSSPDDGGYQIFGAYREDFSVRFDRIHELAGFRCIQPIQRVRDHWVVDTWLECTEGDKRKQVKILSHKYLKQLLRDAKLWSEK